MLPLEKMRVLDLTRVLAGPYATMVLGDLGAEVIKVEPPGGDDSRLMGPFDGAESYCYVQVNRNKRGVVLDVKDPRGRDALLKIAADCDVFVENFRPGTTERLGCDYESVRAVRPDVIYCSISGFGQTGPYARRPAYDIITQGMAGFLRMTGHPGGPPAKCGIAINDLAGAVTAVQSILAAHIARLGGAGGQYLDVSLVESGLAWTVWEAAGLFGAGDLPEPVGTRHRRSAPYQAYRTRDGYVTIGANTERMWRVLCVDVLGRPELADDPRYTDPTARTRHADELEADLEVVLATRTTTHWVEQLLAAGIPAGPVYTYEEALADPHVRERGVTTQIQHPTLGVVDMLTSPLRLSETPPAIRRPSPRFGEHSVEVLTEAGLDGELIGQLERDGVVVGLT